jgi:hypothetical protein
MSQPRRERARKAAPCVQTRQRKPSSFGSKVQPRPWGIVPDRASIGSGSRRATRPERILLVGARQAIASGLTVPVGVSGVSRSLEDAAVLGLRALPLGRCIAVNVGRLVFKWARWHLAGAVARPEEDCGYFLETPVPRRDSNTRLCGEARDRSRSLPRRGWAEVESWAYSSDSSSNCSRRNGPVSCSSRGSRPSPSSGRRKNVLVWRHPLR